MLFHDEELNEEELHKCFKKLDPETIELITQEYNDDWPRRTIAKIKKYVEKHLSWNTLFKSTSDFVSYFLW